MLATPQAPLGTTVTPSTPMTPAYLHMANAIALAVET